MTTKRCRCKFWKTDGYVGWLLIAMTKDGRWTRIEAHEIIHCCFCGYPMRRKSTT